jgi:nucleotide-binding universal stress UspA family protein
MTIRKILCPIDFSEDSRQAMKSAAQLAIEHRAELMIFHAWYIPPMALGSEFGYPAELVTDANGAADRGMAAAVVEARALGVATVSSRVVCGPPWQEIIASATADPAIDLIVIGTHGRTGLARVFLGSVAEMVVRHAPCSVLAIHGRATAFARALCAIDFSDSSRLALQTAFELAGSVELIHVVEPPRIYGEDPVVIKVDQNILSSAEELLRRWAVEARGARQTAFTVQVVVGQPKQELDAKLAAFDLVALGSHGRTGFGRLFLGSVAEHTVRHAGRAVLVARKRGA